MAYPTTFNVAGLVVLQDALDAMIEEVRGQIHYHILLIVEDKTSLDADKDTALVTYMESLGWDVDVADESDVASNLELDAYDCLIVSGSVTTTGNLGNLRTAVTPIITLSADVAVTNLFMGTGASTEATETQVEIIDNTHNALLDRSTGDLTVTGSATLETVTTEGTNAVVLAEEAVATGNDNTILFLSQGEEDDGSPEYIPLFDRYFFGICDFTLIDATGKAIFRTLVDHATHEKKFGEEGTVRARGVIEWDTTPVAVSGSGASGVKNVAVKLIDEAVKTNLLHALRDGWLRISEDPAADTITVTLREEVNGSLQDVDTYTIDTTNYDDPNYHSFKRMFDRNEILANEIEIEIISSGATERDYEFGCIEGSIQK